MNIQEIDKWLDNEYGVSYTRLEELHDYFFEKYVDQKEEIERLNNIINKLEKESYLGMFENQNNNEYAKGLYTAYKYINDKLQELKGEKK